MGVALTSLGTGPRDRWDRHASVDVELLSDAMWLQPRSEASVLAGMNLALLGNELIHFLSAEALGPRRFRLSGLLRGRRGTDAAMAAHQAGERFVLLDPGTLLAFDPPSDRIGATLRFRPAGVGDAAASAIELTLAGQALRPLSPAALSIAEAGGDLTITWKRRSRAGFAWLDFVDAPLAEDREAYRVEVWLDGRLAQSLELPSPGFVYSASQRSADGGGSTVTVAVAQLGAVTGPGAFAAATHQFL
jgi:hypothetical protein